MEQRCIYELEFTDGSKEYVECQPSQVALKILTHGDHLLSYHLLTKKKETDNDPRSTR
jgi:hypothetical protein